MPLAGTTRVAAAGGTFERRSYGYDARGNRTSEGHDQGLSPTGPLYNFTYASGAWQKDQVLAKYDTLSAMRHDYSYDEDGKVTEKRWALGTTGLPTHKLTFSYGPNAAYDPNTTVFKSVSVNGAWYSYFYDAQGRRIRKVYPQGTVPSEEYFYANGSNTLLEDRGFKTTAELSAYPVDEYVWLDGKPVAMIRSKHTLNGTSWVREAGWGTGDCMRNGEPGRCGVHFIVGDYLGKPVLMVDGQGKVEGSGEYEPFGYPNRVSVRGETAHPYTDNLTQTLATFTQPALGHQLQVRAKYHYVETEAGYDYVKLTDTSGNQLGTALSGQLGSVWSGWVNVPANGQVQVRFTSDYSVSYFNGEEREFCSATVACMCYRRPDAGL